MKLNLSRKGTFIPSWENNRDLPEEEQIVIHYKRIVGDMASGLTRFGTDETIVFDNVRIVQKCVTLIENLIDNDNAEIRTAKKLLTATGTHGLVTEIGLHILTDSQLDNQIEKKNKDDITLE